MRVRASLLLCLGLFGIGVAVDQGAFDFFDGIGHGDATRAGFRAVEDRPAAPDAQPIDCNIAPAGGDTVGSSMVSAVVNRMLFRGKDDAM